MARYKLDLIVDGDEVAVILPKSMEESLYPRQLQDLLPKLAKVAPFLNRAGQVVWKVKGIPPLP
jgi:hypothetical protein